LGCRAVNGTHSADGIAVDIVAKRIRLGAGVKVGPRMGIDGDRPAKCNGSSVGLQKATNIAPDTDGKRLDRVANRTRQKIDRPDQQAIDSVGPVDVARVCSDCAFGSVQGLLTR
jgi:hypothetical protein